MKADRKKRSYAGGRLTDQEDKRIRMEGTFTHEELLRRALEIEEKLHASGYEDALIRRIIVAWTEMGQNVLQHAARTKQAEAGDDSLTCKVRKSGIEINSVNLIENNRVDAFLELIQDLNRLGPAELDHAYQQVLKDLLENPDKKTFLGLVRILRAAQSPFQIKAERIAGTHSRLTLSVSIPHPEKPIRNDK